MELLCGFSVGTGSCPVQPVGTNTLQLRWEQVLSVQQSSQLAVPTVVEMLVFRSQCSVSERPSSW